MYSHGIVRNHNHDGNISLDNYHISIGKSWALIKKETETRPENNKLTFLPLQGNKQEESLSIQGSFVTNGLYHLVNDSTLYTINRSDSLYMSRILIMGENFKQLEKKHSIFSYQENPQWSNTIKNDLLKIKMNAISDSKGNTCAIFMYSSWLLCSHMDGTELFLTDHPDQINFPDIPPRIIQGKEFRVSPNSEDHRVQNFDIALDSEYVYVMVFGEEFKSDSMLRNIFRPGTRVNIDKVTTTSDRLYVYEKLTGMFVREINLPHKARAVTVNTHYIVTVEDGEEEGIRWIPKSK